MRLISIILISLLLVLQYPLWFGHGGWLSVRNLRQELIQQQTKNKQDQQRNEQLAAEINDLKSGSDAIESKARYEMGMIKNDEVFVQFVQPGPVAKPDMNITTSAMTELRQTHQKPALIVPNPVQKKKPAYKKKKSNHHQR